MTDITNIDDEDASFTQPSFAADLKLPSPEDTGLLDAAATAVKKEYRLSAKWKRLKCRNSKEVAKSKTGTVFELQIGHAVEFDWTWEGAVAFRPLLLSEFEDSEDIFNEDGSTDPVIDDSIVWSGEVLEVDEATGSIFVVSNPKYSPCRGSFYVRPFEFLSFLNSIYNEDAFSVVREGLPERLAAAQGGIHPDVDSAANAGLERLTPWWRKSWSVLWGPPGTGKTYTTGQQVARVLADDPCERILVVSTTNKATDAAALSIGQAARATGVGLEDGSLLRIGKGASLKKFEEEDLVSMIRSTETEMLARIEELRNQTAQTKDPKIKSLLRKEMKEVQAAMKDAAKRKFLDEDVRTVVSTSFKATTFLCCDEVKGDVEAGRAPFTTIFIDEAGLMSRVAIAALSLLAARRVVLVGDSKQLAPISRISRILEPSQGNWLAKSGVSHLDRIGDQIDGVHVLSEQWRMHPRVCEVVSAFQYGGSLTTAAKVAEREYNLPALLAGQPRAVWYVLDDDSGDDIPSIRAERGPGNRSWVRKATKGVLQKLFADKTLREANGLFISPFKAQAKRIRSYFTEEEMHSWIASTVHSQQGAEADIVIFDSVNAGSYAWAYDEWKRLVNVALSRSREAIIVLSSRAEMDEPYLRPLLQHLSPQVLRRSGSPGSWETVPAEKEFTLPRYTQQEKENFENDGSLLIGNQLATRKTLRPVLSRDQERLCGFELDGKPRLVRGVAGSGKTVVLAHWLTQTVRRLDEESNVRIWTVFANRSLQTLIGDSITSAWIDATDETPLPWDRVELFHIREILDVLLGDVHLKLTDYKFDYDAAAEAYLRKMTVEKITPRCDALFIDEAQDMGPNTLKLLAAIVRQKDDEDENSRSINIFYDNAQNIYDRGTPKWSEFGIDMRGRSSVMTESFRSTKPITEFALNVLYRLKPPESNPDHKELVDRGLVERTEQDGADWWKVRFNQVDGPMPQFHQYKDLDQEFQAIEKYCLELIKVQRVRPSDICLIYNGQDIRNRLVNQIAPKLTRLGVDLSVQTSKPFAKRSNTLVATTPQSFKGYDAEVVIIPAVDQYTAKGKGVLATSLYVAMTRARSMLTLFAQKMESTDAATIYEVIEHCLDNLEERPDIELDASRQDDLVSILDWLGDDKHRKWLDGLWDRYEISQEPITTNEGEIVAEPLFSFGAGKKSYACFGATSPSQRILNNLEDHGFQLLEPGQELDTEELA